MLLLNIYAGQDHLVPPGACDLLRSRVGSKDKEDFSCGFFVYLIFVVDFVNGKRFKRTVSFFSIHPWAAFLGDLLKDKDFPCNTR